MAKKYGWGISHWSRTRKTLFGAQGLLIPESPSFSYGSMSNNKPDLLLYSRSAVLAQKKDTLLSETAQAIANSQNLAQPDTHFHEIVNAYSRDNVLAKQDTVLHNIARAYAQNNHAFDDVLARAQKVHNSPCV